MMCNDLEMNLARWQERISEASAKWGGAEICAVTKTVDVETINRVYDCGIRCIGENRVQEIMEKLDRLHTGFDIHLIGALQTNKVKYIVGSVAMVQSLDREGLADELSRRGVAAGRVIPALVQVNIAREPQKSGIAEEQLPEFIRYCSRLPGIRIEGLMSIMPFVDDPETIRPYFRRMRNWFDRLRDHPVDNVSMNVLSMGMSGDCIVAAQEGATMVRLGRAIFGARPPKERRDS
ncbi:MAG: YggS family pyridoxal phosphate-dependent enzyme [Christensenellales bacterium]|nr:YggS family pyridoxal phosphate-dependent enzyme [Christensenellales bacterium]